jgi:ferredoxin-NADP reductase
LVLTHPPCASSTLALATTIHLALTVLSNHRRTGGTRTVSWPPALISILFTITPWLLPGSAGVAAGLAAHVAWFVACEWVCSETPRQVDALPAAPRASASGVAMNVFIEVPVIATFNETREIKTIRFARPDDFAFEAGQFVTVRLAVDGKEYARCYSISSAPEVRGYFEVSVQRQGVVSTALHTVAHPGAMLAIRRPNGRFVYPAADDRPIVLLAGGVGITPLMSMLRHAVHAEPTRPITLLYSAQTADGFAFRDELSSLERRHPHVRVVFTATREREPRTDVRAGRIDSTLLRAVTPDLTRSIAFICGPKSMIDAMTTLLESMGVASNQVRYEMFEAAVAASAAAPASAATSRAAVAEFPLHCAASGKTVAIRAGDTLLDAAERGGIAVASLCRAGVCGTCRTRVINGDVDCTSTTLDARERADGFVLACVATARTACTVEL